MALAKYYEDNLEMYIERMNCIGHDLSSNLYSYEPYRAVPSATPKTLPTSNVGQKIISTSRTEKTRRRKRCDSLEELSRQAYERGISYGQLIALRSSGMPLPPVIRSASCF